MLKIGKIVMGSVQTNCYFVYKENDKVFLCIDTNCSLEVKNMAKAYLLGVYLLNKQSI